MRLAMIIKASLRSIRPPANLSSAELAPRRDA
jgi:hypothetical protein